MIRQIHTVYRSQGALGLLTAIGRRLYPRSAGCFQPSRALLQDSSALEVGGPSAMFEDRGLFPVYPLLSQLDNCVFSPQTTWQESAAEGSAFSTGSGPSGGQQWIADARELAGLPDASYDCLISAHAIEHIANPLKALHNWCRVLTDSGVLVLVVPHRDGTFDHRRPVTTLSHLMEDLDRDMGEDDLTHLPEILELHDLRKDPEAGSREAFEARSRENFANRCLHHHVFDAALVAAMVDHTGLQILALECVRPYHIILIATQSGSNAKPDNEAFLRDDADFRRNSPFASDRSPRSGTTAA